MINGMLEVPGDFLPVGPLEFDAPAELELAALAQLGAEHQAWPIDVISLGAAAQQRLAQLVTLLPKVLGFWDQRFRRIQVAGGALVCDAAGAYRIIRP